MDGESSRHHRIPHPDFEIISSPHRQQMPSTSSSDNRKRRRISNSTSSFTTHTDDNDDGNPPIDSIDLTEVDGQTSLSKVLAKQREDAVAAQKSHEDEKGRSVLTSYKCPVCMETPVDATSTVCGHLFCHKCIIDTLKFSEEQRADAPGKTPRGTCPVCRKPLSRVDSPGPKRNLIPLQIKLYTRKKDGHSGDKP